MKNDLTNIMNFEYFIRNLAVVCCIEMVILIPTFTIIICNIYKRIYKMKYKIRYTMTYKEFKKKIDEIGLNYCDQSSRVHIYNFNEHRLNQITSSNEDYKLFKLCYELAKTPINKRGELK